MKKRMVKVTWRDACTYHGWYAKEAVAEDSKLSESVSYGILLSKDDKLVRVAHNETGNSWGEVTVIPASQVVSIKTLKE